VAITAMLRAGQLTGLQQLEVCHKPASGGWVVAVTESRGPAAAWRDNDLELWIIIGSSDVNSGHESQAFGNF
jgi:hypothetical protein